MVHSVASSDEFKSQLTDAGSKLVVVDFYATWCGPCKVIAPQIDALSKTKTNIVFLKVDVDENEDLATQYEITAMPTFIFIKNGAKIDSFTGANYANLVEKIAKLE